MLVPKEAFRDPSAECRYPKSIAVLGSTGSIGTSTLSIVRDNPELFQVHTLVAHSNVELLLAQIREFKPKRVFLTSEGAFKKIKELSPLATIEFGTLALQEGIKDSEIDLVVAAMVGEAGLRPVLSALESGKIVALANKESLVAGGKLVERAIASGSGRLIPVDSEHSAIFQALQGERYEDISSITLTASGGPFLNLPLEALPDVTPERAVKHPKWIMGPKISIDSATMMNKALEVIEAFWLFGLSSDQIKVVIHPEHIVHSLISFVDGSVKAQLALPDMRGPIGYALSYPGRRVPGLVDNLNLPLNSPFEFYEVDPVRFPAIQLAKDVLNLGGAVPAVFNSANEVAVQSFIERRIKFTDILPLVAGCVERIGSVNYESLEELEDIVKRTRVLAQNFEGLNVSGRVQVGGIR